MQQRLCVFVVGMSLALLMFAGCSEKRRGPPTVRVAGTLYMNGEPLEGAEVRFISMDFVGYGMSGPDGRYELVQGAVPGENIITVQKLEGNFKLDPEGGYDMGQLEAERDAATGGPGMQPGKRINATSKQIVPAHFSDPTQSKLTYSVPESGTTTADLRLTSP